MQLGKLRLATKKIKSPRCFWTKKGWSCFWTCWIHFQERQLLKPKSWGFWTTLQRYEKNWMSFGLMDYLGNRSLGPVVAVVPSSGSFHWSPQRATPLKEHWGLVFLTFPWRWKKTNKIRFPTLLLELWLTWPRTDQSCGLWQALLKMSSPLSFGRW